MVGRGRSTGILWAQGLAFSLGVVVLLVGETWAQGTLEDAANLNRQVLQLLQEGRYREAIPLAERALAIFEKALGPEHPDVATSLNNLGEVYRYQGDYAQAAPLLNRALAIREKVLGSKHPAVAESLDSLATLYLTQGQLAQAYAILKKEELERSTGLGRYYLLTKEYSTALQHFQPAVVAAEKQQGSTHLVGAYIGLGQALEGLGQYQEAAVAYERAVTHIEEQRAALTPADRVHFLGGEVGTGCKRIEAYEGLVRVKTKLGDPAQALYWAENTKARQLVEALARGGQSSGLPSALAQQEATLTARVASLYRQREVVFGKNPELFKKIEDTELPQAKQALQTFITTLRREQPAYAALTYPQPLGVKELGLHEGEVLLAYEVTEIATFAWLIRGTEIVKGLTIPVTRKALTEQVKQYRDYFEGITTSSQLSKFNPQSGQALYDLLFKEFAPLLKESEPLILVPDEILGGLPFETLVMELPAKVETATGKYGPYPQGVKYLGDLHPISYSPSATALTLARTLKKEQKGKNEKLLLIADPVFEPAGKRLREKKGPVPKGDEYRLQPMRRRDEYRLILIRSVEEYLPDFIFPRLESTGQLAERLRHFYGKGVDVLSGLVASEQEMRKRPLREYRYLLFATHAILDDQVPYINEPALVLSQVGVNSSTEKDQDGFLTLSEVMELELNAEIVVLAANNTGIGRNVAGEGVMGLGWAFQYAGARAVLMSLWSVQEDSTMLLTEKFFSYFKQGKTKLEALRLARADVRKAGYEHPFFWAPFILVGDGEPVQQQTRSEGMTRVSLLVEDTTRGTSSEAANSYAKECKVI